MIDGELGDFLRTRREQVAPEEVGLPAGPRRRTPGLRRAELAMLADISVDYLVRLEQGRDTRPSTQVLAALARALRLDDADRAHLQHLATVSRGTELCTRRGLARDVRPSVRAVLDRLDPAPAYVINHVADLLAWSDGWDRLARPVGLLDGTPPNLLRFVFTDPRAPDAYPDWDDIADDQVARLHSLRRGDAFADELARDLESRSGAEFRRRWERRPLARDPGSVTAMTHPAVGTLRLTVEVMELADPDDQWLVVHLPADAATAIGLDRLTDGPPGALRAVTG
ncbi:MAG: helix-turn-helix transcriptional regulator [Kineosporiaceae bacterium]